VQHEGVPQEVPRHEEALQGQVRRQEEVRNITGCSKEEELRDTNGSRSSAARRYLSMWSSAPGATTSASSPMPKGGRNKPLLGTFG